MQKYKNNYSIRSKLNSLDKGEFLIIMEIRVKHIKKNKNRIEIEYDQQGLEKYIDTTIIPYWEYDCNIEEVPDSIAIIPFVSNFLPLAFVLDAKLYIHELDSAFFNCIDEYRKGYQEMIPMINFKGKVIVDKIIENSYETKKNCLLYSGGIDATNSLAVNEDFISDCLTIWGSDIRSENRDGWLKMYASVKNTIDKYKKKSIVVRSNFRDYISEGAMGPHIEKCGDGWWHGFQHGIAILGHTAPLAFLNGYEKIFIASSFTKEHKTSCASDPLTDNCFKVASSYAVHDGYEFDRCQKVKNIFDSIEKKNITLNLHVCWKSDSGKNCGHCEKCVRSYLNCRAVNCDSSKIGIIPAISMEQIKQMYNPHKEFDSNGIYRLQVIINNLKKTYDNNPPKDLEWLAAIDTNKINTSLYWKLKKIYRRVRYGKKF